MVGVEGIGAIVGVSSTGSELKAVEEACREASSNARTTGTIGTIGTLEPAAILNGLNGSNKSI
jgi:hypothetical protein